MLQRAAQRAEHGADHQGHHQQEAQAQHQAQRQDAILDHALDAPSGAGFHLPDRVERRFQLDHDGGGPQHQGAQTHHRPHDAGTAFGRFGQHLLHHLGGLGPEHGAQLVEDLSLRGFLPEDQPRHRDRHQQHRREGEHRVVGQRGPQPGRLVFAPFVKGALDQPPGGPPAPWFAGPVAGGGIGRSRLCCGGLSLVTRVLRFATALEAQQTPTEDDFLDAHGRSTWIKIHASRGGRAAGRARWPPSGRAGRSPHRRTDS